MKSSPVTRTYEPTFRTLPNDRTEPAPVPPSQPDSLQGVLVIAADGSARLEPERYANDGLTHGCSVMGSDRFRNECRDTVLASTVYWALQAQDWAKGTGCRCSGAQHFSRRELVLPSGPQWDRAVTTALLGDWIDPLIAGECLDKTAYSRIKTEAHTVHQQLVPLWRRRVRGTRVALLETPLGENLTLLDLVVGDLRMDDLVFESAFDDERINAIVAQLSLAERRVAMAWAHPAIATWTEAAPYAGAADPEAFGERVRRKLKRLGTRYTTRTRAAAAPRDGVR
ncbi:hypothetical protein [Streptomyces sp. KR55]|uniref:hypothetical protein n=1 Tax=Streptomyces sp. KR55 TaxID=3457425 RepID=UPI003FD31527